MRRIARNAAIFLFTAALVLISFVPARAESHKPSVLIKIKDASQIAALSAKYNWKVREIINNGNVTVAVVEGVTAAQVAPMLRSEATVAFVEDNAVVPLDGGETVLPLDGGETVLPLDGGETVLPLGSGEDQTIAQLMGQSALTSVQLTTIRNAYSTIAGLVTPSARLIIQPAFNTIGLYSTMPQATGHNVVIADLDTGADTCHPALQGVVTYTFVQGADANAPENCPTGATTVVPGFGHGTRVAGLLRLAAPGANIWSLRVFDNSGSAQTSTIYSAIVFAVNSGANVINMSFGTATYSQALQDAVSYAQSRGVILVAAGGNINAAPLMYPAQLPGVDGVVAVGNTGVKTSFSNYGFGANVAAPGYGLWTAYPGNQMAYVAGTSYASPLVAADAALVIDSYQRIYRGQPSASSINRSISRGVLPIDWLNPNYAGQLGTGLIQIPLAVLGSLFSN